MKLTERGEIREIISCWEGTGRGGGTEGNKGGKARASKRKNVGGDGPGKKLTKRNPLKGVRIDEAHNTGKEKKRETL